jgi:hypothetical protein
MNKLIMMLESIKNSNYIIEENTWEEKELILKNSNGEKTLIIEFNTENNLNYLWDVCNYTRPEFIGKKSIQELEEIIKLYYK